MAIATRIKWYLESQHIDYEVIQHNHTNTALGSARAAHVPSGLVAKCVLLEDERGYVMAVIPASCRVEIEAIDQEMGRHLELASEGELGGLFATCEVGAVPPLGDVFNIPSAVDQSLMRLPDAYFEAGDHERLIHVSGEDFRSLLCAAHAGRFSRPN
jgi:Ala-tRNA(Pro) deacylase